MNPNRVRSIEFAGRYKFVDVYMYEIDTEIVNEPRHNKTNKVTVRPAKTFRLSLRCALNG